MTPRKRATGSLFVIGLTAATSMAACLDATPYEVAPITINPAPHQTPVGIDDAASDALDAAHVESCEECLGTAEHPGTGCTDVVNTCENNPVCSTAYHCAINVGCLDSATVDAFIACGISCANEAGLVDYSDPAFLQMYAIFTCASAACGKFCLFAKGADASLH